MVPPRLEAAIQKIQTALPQGPYAFNLIHSPHEEAMERNTVSLYLKHAVTTVEASAFLDLTPSIVRYRAAGLSQTADRWHSDWQPGNRQGFAHRSGAENSCSPRPRAC